MMDVSRRQRRARVLNVDPTVVDILLRNHLRISVDRQPQAPWSAAVS